MKTQPKRGPIKARLETMSPALVRNVRSLIRKGHKVADIAGVTGATYAQVSAVRDVVELAELNAEPKVAANITPRNDNMPEKMTAHAVRKLTVCKLCGGLGDRTQMIEGTMHTSCAAALLTLDKLGRLPREELAKFRIGDMSDLPAGRRDLIIDRYRADE